MVKRVFLFIVTNLLVMLTLSIAWSLLTSFLGLGPVYNGYLPFMLIFSAFWGMGGAFISLFLSKWMAKMMMRVQVIDPKTTHPEMRTLIDMVYELARKAKLPKMPEVGFYESPEVNAFATGPSKSNSLVAVSSGLLHRMNRDELEGVLGHEIAHIANGDMVTMTLVQGIINAFVIFFSRIIAKIVGSNVEEKNRYWVEFLSMIAFEILFGILGAIVVNYFSRLREFRADLGSAQIAGKHKMLQALQALTRTREMIEPQGEGFASLKIAGKKGWMHLFSTHPAIEERIARLERAQVV